MDERPRPLYREVPEGGVFPVEALGTLLQSAAEAINDIVRAPMALCGQAVLATATLAVQGLADVRLPYGEPRPLSGYYLAIAESGERKTACDSLAGTPVKARERELDGSFKIQFAEYKATLAAHEAEWKSAEREKLGREARKARLIALGERPLPPPQPILICAEPTYEGLFRLVREGPRSVGIFSAEGGQLVGGFAMSDEQRLRTAAALSAGWDGAPWKRIRGGDGLTVLHNRRVSLNLMVQPRVAMRLLSDEELRDQGFLWRILITAPSAASGTRLWRDPRPESEKALSRYTEGLLALLRLPTPPEDKPLPVLNLEENARSLWTAFADCVERQLGSDGKLAPIRGFANKAAEHATRIAGVLAIVRDADARVINGEDLAAGVELVNHYLGEALRLRGAAQTDTVLQRAERLRRWLFEKWDALLISLVDVYRLGPPEFRDEQSANAAMDVISDHGWVIRLDGTHEVKGERRRDVWRIVRETA
jgi:hypothetical protein